jgi:NADPH:quinone reductase
VSLALVPDRRRVVTIAAAPRAKADGYVFVGASNPESGPFRARTRSRILGLAQRGGLVVPMAATFPFEDAPAPSSCPRARTRPARSPLSS